MGQYGHSNQVAHHVTYMYDAASQPYKTQEKVREVLGRLYTGSEIGQGYHGDEDNGEQSAWFLFSSLGFYPLVMGSGEYAIGSPLFTKATVHLENGRKLVVKAPKNSAKNIYVQGLKVNGKKWTATSLPHDLLAKGGTLDFDMGAKPSAWGGTGKHDAPVSITQDDQVPSPAQGRAEGRGPAVRRHLGHHRHRRHGRAARIVRHEGRPVHADLGRQATAPTGWVLQGSSDGKSWKDLDKRSGQTFTWDKQTRAFSVKTPRLLRALPAGVRR